MRPMPAARTKTSREVLDAAESASLDVSALVKRVDDLLAGPLYWFPVRHHSPAIARHIAACIRERKPKVVFIEGPHEAQAMVEFIVDPQTRPPVAIYSSFRDDRSIVAAQTAALAAGAGATGSVPPAATPLVP